MSGTKEAASVQELQTLNGPQGRPADARPRKSHCTCHRDHRKITAFLQNVFQKTGEEGKVFTPFVRPTSPWHQNQTKTAGEKYQSIPSWTQAQNPWQTLGKECSRLYIGTVPFYDTTFNVFTPRWGLRHDAHSLPFRVVLEALVRDVGGKEETKLFLFRDNMAVYTYNLKKHIQKVSYN